MAQNLINILYSLFFLYSIVVESNNEIDKSQNVLNKLMHRRNLLTWVRQSRVAVEKCIREERKILSFFLFIAKAFSMTVLQQFIILTPGKTGG